MIFRNYTRTACAFALLLFLCGIYAKAEPLAVPAYEVRSGSVAPAGPSAQGSDPGPAAEPVAPSDITYSPARTLYVPYSRIGPVPPPVILCAPPEPVIVSDLHAGPYPSFQSPVEEPASGYYGTNQLLVDSLNRAVSQRFQGLAKGFDRWLAKSTYTVDNGSNLDVRVTMNLKEYQKYELVPRVYFTVRLPMTDSKVKLMVQHYQKGKETLADSQERIAHGQPTGGGTSVGGKRDYPVAGRLKLELDGGVKTKLKLGELLRLYARAGVAHEMVFGTCNSRMFAQAGWYSRAWVDFSGGLLLNIALPNKALFSINTTGEFPSNSTNVNIYESVNYTKQISKVESYGLSAGLHAYTQPAAQAESYVLGANYRRNLHHYWVYGELSPELAFPMDRNFKPVPGLFLKINVYFGKQI